MTVGQPEAVRPPRDCRLPEAPVSQFTTALRVEYMLAMSRLRFAARLSTALLLLACGGGGDASTEPGPPPPPPTPPALARIAVAPVTVSFDAVGQSRTLTATLAPAGATGSVVWRSADPAIAAVTGSGTSATVTAVATGSTQIVASVGAIEGSASVTVPAVPQQYETNIPATGGTLRLDIPGHPFADFTLAVPPGSFIGTTAWRVSTDSSPPPVFPAGVTVRGPGLRIDGPTAVTRDGELLTLRIPVTAAAGEPVVIALVDVAGGTFGLLPLVGRDANSVTVITRHLDPTRFASTVGPAPTRFGQSESGVLLLRLGVTPAMLQNISATMQATRHAWPIAEDGSATHPEGHGSTKAVLSMAAASLDLDLQTLIRRQGNGWFYRDTAPLATVMITSLLQRQWELGLRAVREVRPLVTSAHGGVPSGSTPFMTAPQLKATPKPTWDSLTAINLLAGMALTGEPQLFLTLASADHIDARDKQAWAVAVSAENGVIRYLDPVQPGTTRSLPLTAVGFAPVPSKSLVSDPAPTDRSFLVATPAALLDLAASRQQLQQLEATLRADGTERDARNRALWSATNSRTLDVQTRRTSATAFTSLDGPLSVFDTAASLQLAVHEPTHVSMRFYHPTSGAEVLRAAGTERVSFDRLLDAVGVPAGEKATVEGVVVDETNGRQLVPLRLEVTRGVFRIERDTVQLRDSSFLVWKVEVMEPPAEGFRVAWDFGDGTDTTSEANVVSQEHLFTRVDTFTVTARLLSIDDPAEEIARDDAVAITAPMPFWQLTSIADPNNWRGSSDASTYPQLRDILNTPSIGLIAVSVNNSDGASPLVLWRMPVQRECCRRSVRSIGGISAGGAVGVGLGELPERTWPVGPAFASFARTGWWQSTTDLTTGTMQSTGYSHTGQFYNVPNGPQIAPGGGPRVFRLVATRSGDQMTGTIELYLFRERDNNNYLINATVPTFVFPFVAKRKL